jgi:hypothetical protein
MRLTTLPLLKVDYFANSSVVQAEQFRQSGLSVSKKIKPSDGINCDPCEFRIWMFFTSGITAFISHVIHIISLCSKKQVVWPDAFWRIAFMQKKKTVWNGAIHENPCCAMGKLAAIVSSVYDPIPITVQCAIPKPAAIGFPNVFPKSLPEVVVKSLRKCWVLCRCFVGHIQVTVDCALVAPIVYAMRGNEIVSAWEGVVN